MPRVTANINNIGRGNEDLNGYQHIAECFVCSHHPIFNKYGVYVCEALRTGPDTVIFIRLHSM